jgi:uncharacterized Zn-binding protein involved in type VI secretion
MAFFAAHQKGACLCPQHQLSTATEPGAATSVTFNSVGAQAVGDHRRCLGKGGGTDTVIGGSATVLINGRSAVPCWKAVTAHGGIVVLGSLNITIGGPMVIGPHARFAKACHSVAATREDSQQVADRETGGGNPYKKYDRDPYRQGWNNCGPECARMLLHGLGGKKLTEWQMLDWALKNGRADWGTRVVDDPSDSEPDPLKKEKIEQPIPRGTPDKRTIYEQLHDTEGGSSSPGGSNQADWRAMTEEHGVETENLTPNPGTQPMQDCVAGSLREGKPVIYSVQAGWLAQDAGNGSISEGYGGPGDHVVLITGYEADSHGNPIAFYVNDPALGCSIRVSAEHLAKMERKGYGMVRPARQAW